LGEEDFMKRHGILTSALEKERTGKMTVSVVGLLLKAPDSPDEKGWDYRPD